MVTWALESPAGDHGHRPCPLGGLAGQQVNVWAETWGSGLAGDKGDAQWTAPSLCAIWNLLLVRSPAVLPLGSGGAQGQGREQGIFWVGFPRCRRASGKQALRSTFPLEVLWS